MPADQTPIVIHCVQGVWSLPLPKGEGGVRGKDVAGYPRGCKILGCAPRRFLKDCSLADRFVCMTGRVAMGESSDDSIPTRASLLGRLKNWDDQASWEDFARTYSRLIRGFAIQSGLTEGEAKEVEQETLLCVAKTIHQFESNPERGTFKAW